MVQEDKSNKKDGSFKHKFRLNGKLRSSNSNTQEKSSQFTSQRINISNLEEFDDVDAQMRFDAGPRSNNSQPLMAATPEDPEEEAQSPNEIV